jgi:hypothetical protein
LRDRSMRDVANLAGAVVFVMRNVMRVSDRLCAK